RPGDVGAVALRGDYDERVAHEDLAGILDELSLQSFGHVGDVSTDIDIGLCALLELSPQSRTAPELKFDVGLGVLLNELGLDLIERVGQRRCDERRYLPLSQRRA